MSELLSIENYQSDIQFIDKDYTASMFMATCELNKVYSEYDYKLFVAMECFNVDFKSLEDSIYDMWGDISQYPPEAQGIIAEAIQQQILESKKQKAFKEWENIKNEKIMDISFKYPSSWTYNDVLLYFQREGYPQRRYSQQEILESNMNVCKARHILRNDIMTDESILLAFIEMWERKKDIEAYQASQKVWQIVMMVVSAIFTIIAIATPFLQPLSGWALGAAITGIITSVGSLGLSIYNFVAAEQNAQAMEETTKQTNDLILKNMPKAGNFVDTAISDPYAMYANGRLYKQGGAGQERYDSMLPHEPYKYLDDKFKDSDMYDLLNNKIDKFAGGDDYFPSLYRDAKWTNPKAMKALLNGAIPIYLSQRTKTIETIFKWLSKEGLGTYYLWESNWRKSDEYINRYYRVQFQDESSIYGFTKIEVTYQSLNLITQISTATKYFKDSKQESGNITDSNRIIFIKEETKIMKGSEINLQTFESTSLNVYAERVYNGVKPYAKDSIYYEVTYKLYSYGGKEVPIYSQINELKDYKDNEKLQYTNKVSLKVDRIKAPQDYIWRVRKEHTTYLRFKNSAFWLEYTEKDEPIFQKEELLSHTMPFVTNGQYFRYFDKNTRFAYWKKEKGENSKLYACADKVQKDFIKTTIYSHNNEGKITDYMSLNNFISAKRYITLF